MKYLVFIFALLILSPLVVSAATSGIVIGHVQPNGTTADDEFIELTNTSSEIIDIGSFSIQYKSANGSTFYKKNFVKGTIILPSDSYVVCGKDYLGNCDMKHSSFSLSASGGTVFLVSNQTLLTSASNLAIVDERNYLEEVVIPINETPAPTNPTPVATTTNTTKQNDVAKIIINEFMPDPESGAEWIELYNPTGYAIDLTGWTLADGTGKTFFTLSNLLLPTNFKLVELSSAHLNNDGDQIFLRDPNKVEVDTVAYGSWDENTANAPVGETGIAIARNGDGVDSNRDNYDFSATGSPTPEMANKISPTPTISVSEKAPKATSQNKTQNKLKTEDLTWLTDLLESKNLDLANLLKSENVIIINNLYIGSETQKPIQTPEPKTKIATTKTSLPTTKTTPPVKVTTAKSTNTVTGQIIVPVGLTGKDMAIVRESDKSVEVRLPKEMKELPSLGDTISTSGTWSEAKTITLPRLLVKTNGVVTIIDHGTAPDPKEIKFTELEENVGLVVTLQGTIVEKQPTRFRLADGDKSVLIKSAFAGSRDETATATGLITKLDSEYFLTPTSSNTLTIVPPPEKEKPPLTKKIIPYAIAILPAGILTAAVTVGRKIRKRKGGDSQ